LLQALLALSLVVAFVPFLASRVAGREKDAQMHVFTTQITSMQNAARLYLTENINDINYNITTVSGRNLVDMLEPYGMPLGFVPRTVFSQDISLVTHKTEFGTLAYLAMTGGKLSGIDRAQQVRRLGFYASTAEDIVYMIIPLDTVFSDLVRRDEKRPAENGFLSDLDMGGNDIERVGMMQVRNGEFETVQISSLSLFGLEEDRKIRNKIGQTNADKTIFQSALGESALSVTRGTLVAQNADLRTIAKFGDTANFEGDVASVYDFTMSAGRSGFSGPANWDIQGDVITDNITFDTEVLEVSSSINASRGQDVYISDTLEYSMQSGIEANVIRAANITMRDQTSTELLAGGSGKVILDIRPAGVSMLPDVSIGTISNDGFKIISRPDEDDGETIDCRSVISSLGAAYDANSLSQNIICRYVFWQRLEKRIDIKQCMLNGGSDC
jgi:hypothetical protein